MNAKLEYCGDYLEITNFKYYPDEEEQGNPYNSDFDVKVVSGDFSGLSPYWEYDHKMLADFIEQLKDLMYARINEVVFQEIGTGQKILFKGDGQGHITVSGTICSEGVHTQSLSFEFVTDQTVYHSFIDQLQKL